MLFDFYFQDGTSQKEEVIKIIAFDKNGKKIRFSEDEIRRGWCIIPRTETTFKLAITGKDSALVVSKICYKDESGSKWRHKDLSIQTVLPHREK